MKTLNSINCPKCNTSINVENLISSRIENELHKKYNLKEQVLKDQFKKRVDEEKNKWKNEIKESFQKESEGKMKELEKELNEKSQKIQNLLLMEAKLKKVEREKKESDAKLKVEFEEKLNTHMETFKTEYLNNKESEKELTIKKLQKQLNDQKDLTEKMKQKQEQGSMQLQGEVQELAIEEWLQNHFTNGSYVDNIKEIGKGQRGADCIHEVIHKFNPIGSIYYESKRTKSFKEEWVEKFKEDMKHKKADVGVIVTSILPKKMKVSGYYKGVFVCTFAEFKSFSIILRRLIIETHHAKLINENKQDKMVRLYDFFSSSEFKLRMESILERCAKMQETLGQEKRAYTKIWKIREKEIEKMIEDTISIHGSIKGIGENEIKNINGTDLPYLSNIIN